MTAHAVPRRSLQQDATIAGVGLFTAQQATLTLRPSAQGLRLRTSPRAVDPLAPRMVADRPLHPAFHGMAPRSTNLSARGVLVGTVEHLLSALIGLGITDADIELSDTVNGLTETPIFDGSATPFVDILQAAGVADIPNATTTPLTIQQPITVTDDHGATIIATPRQEPGCHYRYELDYGPGAPIPAQHAEITLSSHGDARRDYVESVAPARTFSLRAEAEAMQAAGLFAHLSPKDMLVIDEHGPIDNPYRLDHEPARHKLLDLIGDLALINRPLQLNITATRAGHALNHELARALLDHA
ncbi:MAG: UDP-3-O-acyl-N-acetylglucosamine deacetylase [Planctomycetota bacterium]